MTMTTTVNTDTEISQHAFVTCKFLTEFVAFYL